MSSSAIRPVDALVDWVLDRQIGFQSTGALVGLKIVDVDVDVTEG